MQEVAVADLDPVTPAARQPAQETVQGLHEIPAAREVSRAEVRKLEHEQRDVRPERFAGIEKRRGEQVGVEKAVVRLAGPPAEAGQRGESFEGDRIRHLEGEEEVRRHLREQAFEVAALGEPVVGRVHADGLEDLGVFRQAEPLEARGGIASAPHVAGPVVEHPLPAGYFQDEVPRKTPCPASVASCVLRSSRWNGMAVCSRKRRRCPGLHQARPVSRCQRPVGTRSTASHLMGAKDGDRVEPVPTGRMGELDAARRRCLAGGS